MPPLSLSSFQIENSVYLASFSNELHKSPHVKHKQHNVLKVEDFLSLYKFADFAVKKNQSLKRQDCFALKEN